MGKILDEVKKWSSPNHTFGQPFSHLTATAPLFLGEAIVSGALCDGSSPRPTEFCVFLVGVDVPGDPRSTRFCFLSGYACFMVRYYSFLQSKSRLFSGRRGRRPLQMLSACSVIICISFALSPASRELSQRASLKIRFAIGNGRILYQ